MRRLALAAFVAAGASACYGAPVLDLGPVPAGVVAETQITYYDISAATLSEINQAMRASGPRNDGRRWGAMTTWNLSWQSQNRPLGGSCEARRVHIRVRTAINFPRWNPTAQPDSALLVFWQQYNAGLAEHERGHALLALKTAGEMVHAMEGMQAPCQMLNAQLGETFSRLMTQLNTAEREYDVTTRHGATQIQQARALQEP